MSGLLISVLSANLNDLLGLHCFVPSAALRVQELEYFLKSVGVRGVAEERAFPLDVDEVFHPQFVEVVREG
jgi:hypothetical protein